MPHEYKDGEVVDGTQEGPIQHGLSSGACGTVYALSVNEAGQLITAGNLVPDQYDQISLAYDGAALTSVVYINSAATVATLVLAYDGENLTSVVKSP